MKILYIGSSGGNSVARFETLRRIGHDAIIIDPYKAISGLPFGSAWATKTGALGLAGYIERYVMAQVKGRFDLVLVDSGDLVGPGLLRHLRSVAPRVCNQNNDNPYVVRDGWRWRLFLKALPRYDVMFTTRASSIAPAIAAGARRVERVWSTTEDALADPANHPTEEERAPYRSKLAFIGTWMPERGPFLLRLIERGLPLRILGPRWNKAPEYERLRPHLVEGALSPRQYQSAVAAADISIGLLSKGNEDLYTRRSIEIPVLGSLLCGERTIDHLALYDEGREAVFFSDADECARRCEALLAHPARCAAMREAGRQRALANGHFHSRLMMHIVDQATS